MSMEASNGLFGYGSLGQSAPTDSGISGMAAAQASADGVPQSLVEQLAYPLFPQSSMPGQPATGILHPEIRSDASLGEDSALPAKIETLVTSDSAEC